MEHNDRPGFGRTLAKRWDAVLAAIAVVVAIGYFGPNMFAPEPSAGPDVITGTGGDPYPTHALASGPAATSTATADPAGPFAHTPAATWAEGEAGIALPAATDIEGFTAAEVESALSRIRAVLVAARLDRRLLVDHDPTTFLDLMPPAGRDDVESQIRAGTMGSLLVISLVQDGARLADLTPRVSGRTSFKAATDRHGLPVLEIVTNYVWAYAFASDAVVVVHDEVHWHFYRAGDVRDTQLGPWPVEHEGYLLGMDCAAAKNGFLAPPTSYQVSGTPTERPGSLYEPDHSLDIAGNCPD